METYYVPTGFPILIQKEFGEGVGNIVVDPENFKVNQKVLNSFQKLTELGFLPSATSSFFFPRPFHKKSFRYSYAVIFDSILKENPHVKQPRLRYNANGDHVNVPHIPRLDGTTFEVFEHEMVKRYSGYSFTPVNGWEPIRYLDFVTHWANKWSENEIHALDECISAGISVKRIWLLLHKGTPVEYIKDFNNLPNKWLDKALS